MTDESNMMVHDLHVQVIAAEHLAELPNAVILENLHIGTADDLIFQLLLRGG